MRRTMKGIATVCVRLWTELYPFSSMTCSERGLLDSTIVLAMGEFGRTPFVNPDLGRDHWPTCWSLALGGGGIKGGQVIGSSDENGAYVTNRATSMGDIFATIYKAFGIDWTIEYDTAIGRPMKIANSLDDETGQAYPGIAVTSATARGAAAAQSAGIPKEVGADCVPVGSYVLNQADRQVVYTLFPALQQEFGFSDAVVGLTGALFCGSTGCARRLSGILGDRWSKTKLDCRQPCAVELLHCLVRAGAERQPFCSSAAHCSVFPNRCTCLRLMR